MTRPGSRFVESLTSKGVKPAVTVTTSVVAQSRRWARRTVENAFHVHSEDVVPSLFFGEVVIRATPGDTRVVDENVQLALMLLEFSNEVVATLLRLLKVSFPDGL